MFDKKNSLHGELAFTDFENNVHARNAFVAGRNRERGNKAGNIVIASSPDTVAKFDDFLGNPYNLSFDTGGDLGIGTNGEDWLPSALWAFGQQDTGQKLTLPAVAGGVARMISSATSTQTPIGGAMSLHGEKNWKADNGGLRMAARVKIEQLSGSNVFVGFTDTGGGEMPVYDTGSEVTETLTPAADFVGFLYSGAPYAATRGRTTWRAVSAKGGTDQNLALAYTPVANVYDHLEVQVDADGGAKFFVNGYYAGKLDNAVTKTVALADHVGYSQTEAAAKYVDADWVNVSANRDTGE